MFELTTDLLESLPQNGPTDPIHYYRNPVVGWLFRKRINRGLRLLPSRPFHKALEVGYGAGAVLLALSESVGELHGLDLDADPAPTRALLASRGASAELVQASVIDLPYSEGAFDLAVCFSVFEHLDRYRLGLEEVARVLRPGGLFLLGMPAVNKTMELGFSAIGFRDIDQHHVTMPAQVAACFGDAGFGVLRTAHVDVPFSRPFGLRVYYNWLLEKVDRPKSPGATF
jgi:SAM-dependent methyltransferase